MPENEESMLRLYVPGWVIKAQKSQRGAPLSNLANVMLVLKEDSFWLDVVRFNEMERVVELFRPVPQLPFELEQVDGPWEPRPLTDTDVVQATLWMQKAGLVEANPLIVGQALDLRAKQLSYHPVRDWLNGLVWDGVPRLDNWLSTYCGATDTPYERGVGRLCLLSIVARVMQPGCKCDYMVILEGPQGLGKSTICSILGGKWFTDNLPDNLESKDTAVHLRGKLVVEFGELHQLGKAEVTQLKKFLTKTTEKYRPPYGKLEVVEPRQCVFFGTTNEEEYLRDPTGDRRFWPVVTKQCNIAEFERDRDQLFAEALVAYRAGEQWWPSWEFEQTYIKEQQDDRYETDPWEERVSKFLGKKTKVTSQDVYTGALGLAPKDQTQYIKRRVSTIMKRLGWKSSKSDTTRLWIRQLL